ncbi:MAG: UDP-N-acetylglucosamine 1-carboxyvinyltransferase [Firmicutes bacterium]|nr:UDP-N-acetylglucosamine 1-carboxyvinyltransferase [Bacillota bacterium]
MPKYAIRGGRRLTGSVKINGRKNAALPLIAATLLAEGTSVLENVPRIRDVEIYREMLDILGVQTEYDPVEHRLTVNPEGLRPAPIPHHLAGAIRASYYLLGVQLGLFGRAEVPLPGGDKIGQRPVDQHIKALTALGAEVWMERGVLKARADRLRGTSIYFDLVSVGATIHTMLVAVRAEGTTVLHNAAREPHVVDVANFLNACGAQIHGAGTDTIRIRGGRFLEGRRHCVIPDDIEAATFMLAGAITWGDVRVENVIPLHLGPVIAKLREAGVEVEENGDSVRVTVKRRPRGIPVTTLPYPGFPTDAQSQMTAFLSLAEGESHVTETLYEDRFRYVPDLVRMGARIRVEGRTAWIQGVERLTGVPVEATDIRAGAALVLAGLAAEGVTIVSGIEHVERGYDDLPGRLNQLGAEIERID